MAGTKAAVSENAQAEQAFAIIRSGGKQYRVTKGMRLRVEKLEAEAGSTITLSDVLMAGKVGGSDIKVATASQADVGAKVTARVVGEVKEKKVIIFKKRLKGGYTKKQGHRQKKTEVIIEDVAL